MIRISSRSNFQYQKNTGLVNEFSLDGLTNSVKQSVAKVDQVRSILNFNSDNIHELNAEIREIKKINSTLAKIEKINENLLDCSIFMKKDFFYDCANNLLKTELFKKVGNIEFGKQL